LRKDDKTALDLYCGVGIISQYLSPHLESVKGIEINKRQIKQAKECLELNDIKNAEYIFADAKEFLNYSSDKCDLLIVNPPRAGMDRQVTTDIINYKPNHIIYSSCNPDTFSRDASWLIEGGYKLLSVQPFDMFPQTHHLELVGDFVYNS
jgi:23S rRNA (uracil1939-C5)-methyltransferase